MTARFETIIFDLDGTLYDEERIYDYYAEELATRLPREQRDSFVRTWGEVKTGRGPRLMGLGYDVARDLLFTHAGGRPIGYVTWEGTEVRDMPAPEPAQGPLQFGYSTPYINIGDRWALLAALAARHGISGDARQEAFRATRAHMSSDAGRLQPSAALRRSLLSLRDSGPRLIAMSNSPAGSVADTFVQLGVTDCFDAIIADASKPAGMMAFLQEDTDPTTTLSVGDNYVNDIEPALDAGAWALYIDRHSTKLGADRDRCMLVLSMDAAWIWLRDRFRA